MFFLLPFSWRSISESISHLTTVREEKKAFVKDSFHHAEMLQRTFHKKAQLYACFVIANHRACKNSDTVTK
jgi:hypothetical protein